MFAPSDDYTQTQSSFTLPFHIEAIQSFWENYSNCSEQNPLPPYAMPQTFFLSGTTEESKFSEAVSTEAALFVMLKNSISLGITFPDCCNRRHFISTIHTCMFIVA